MRLWCDFEIEVMTKVRHDKYNSGYVPNYVLKSIFIDVLKKAGTLESEDHRTVPLIVPKI